MHRIAKWVLPLIVLAFGAVGFAQESGALWPPIKAYRTGYLRVSPLHEVYYQLGGNPKGKPVMFLHGGPGGGCSENDFRYFNPEVFHIVLHDQRGSSQSRPYGEVRENTTADLVQDVEKLRTHLGLGKVILFGGSWGSTLALAYAEAYPQNVSGMVLRGIFTGTKAEIDHYYHGPVAEYFPETYQKLVDSLDHPERKNYPVQLLAKLKSADPAVRERTAMLWALYEGKIAFLYIDEKWFESVFRGFNPYAFAIIENHYMANGCFLAEGQLQKNAAKIAEIPLVMVNGRFDVICPPITAYRLHRLLPKSTLVIVEKAGHSATEPGIEAELLKAMRGFEK